MTEPTEQSWSEEYMGYFLSAFKQRGTWACKIYDQLMKPIYQIDIGCKTSAGCLGHAREFVEQRVREQRTS